MSDVEPPTHCYFCGKDINKMWAKCPFCTTLIRCTECNMELTTEHTWCPSCGLELPKIKATRPEENSVVKCDFCDKDNLITWEICYHCRKKQNKRTRKKQLKAQKRIN